MNLTDKLSQNKIFPIIRSADKRNSLDLGKLCIDSGLDVIEINVSSPEIFDVISELSDKAIICAGGIITSLQAQTAIDCGAKIFSSPIYQQNLVKVSKDRQVPFIAGTSTANEAYQAWKSRIPIVKIYPIEAMGGTNYIKNLLRPMPFLNVIVQGAVKLESVKDYIESGALAVGIGRDLFKGSDYNEISKRIKTTLENLR